jgi:hypothetical protein
MYNDDDSDDDDDACDRWLVVISRKLTRICNYLLVDVFDDDSRPAAVDAMLLKQGYHEMTNDPVVFCSKIRSAVLIGRVQKMGRRSNQGQPRAKSIEKRSF